MSIKVDLTGDVALVTGASSGRADQPACQAHNVAGP